MAAGRTVLDILRVKATSLERNLYSLALGLGMLAYGMLALGLVGLLYPIAGWLLIVGLVALGSKSYLLLGREIAAHIRCGVKLSAWGWATAVVFLLLALIPLLGVWTPPTISLEWDSLSYHLADPKLYLQAHRIYYLPWESHSNFAFTAEMWYLFGLMEGGVPLAKLFHYTCSVGMCFAVYALGARHVSARVGLLAALVLASTPLVLWEAGTAYTDLAGTFFATLTLLAVANGMVAREPRWFWLGAVLMGLTLSTKATALGTLALLAAGLLYWSWCVEKKTPLQAVRTVGLWCLLALAVGSPWYVKSVVYTGNPVYPFYSQIFGGRYWNKELGAAYDASNANFGVGKTLQEVHSPAAAVLSPWNLTMYLLPGHPPPSGSFRPFNDTQTPLSALSPLLLAALFFPAFSRGAPRQVKALGLYAVLSSLLWFASAEYIRYLLPAVPVFCLLAAWVLVRAWEERWKSGYALAGLGVCSLAFTFYVGAGLVALEAPVVFGRQSRDEYITRGFAPYSAMQFINTQLPKDAKIVFYGSPFGFYCDKAYFWGDQEHSTYIPYDTFHTAEDLRVALQKIGVTHILVAHMLLGRPNFDPQPDAQDYTRWVYALTEGTGPPVFEKRGVAVYALPGAKP
jgi:hypothetical protein